MEGTPALTAKLGDPLSHGQMQLVSRRVDVDAPEADWVVEPQVDVQRTDRGDFVISEHDSQAPQVLLRGAQHNSDEGVRDRRRRRARTTTIMVAAATTITTATTSRITITSTAKETKGITKKRKIPH